MTPYSPLKRLLTLTLAAAVIFVAAWLFLGLVASAAHAQTPAGPTGPLVVQSLVDNATPTGTHLTFSIKNPLPPSGAAVTIPPVSVTINYTDSADPPNSYSATSQIALVMIPASSTMFTITPFKFVVPAVASLTMDPSVPQTTYALINLMDSSTQVTLTPATLDGGQTETWGWTVSRRK